jgi:hypothetical protein
MKYKIITSCTAITEYTVEADSPEQAEEKFYDGDARQEQVCDWRDEEIIEVEQR